MAVVSHIFNGTSGLLWKEFEHNREGYTAAKAEFVRKYTDKAKLKYGKRY